MAKVGIFMILKEGEILKAFDLRWGRTELGWAVDSARCNGAEELGRGRRIGWDGEKNRVGRGEELGGTGRRIGEAEGDGGGCHTGGRQQRALEALAADNLSK